MGDESPAVPPELTDAWGRLGPRAQAVLLVVARRLAMGADQYGDFEPGYHWRLEAMEEAVDCAIYLARRLVDE